MDNVITRAEHEEFVRRMEDEHHRLNRRMEEVENQVKENGRLLSSVEKLADSMKRMQAEQEKQGERLDVLEGRDGEMWRKVVGYAVTFIVGAVLSYIFAHIGM